MENKVKIDLKEPHDAFGFKQGLFYFGTKGRIATATGVVFLNRNTIVGASRCGGMLYLIKLTGDRYQIIDKKTLSYNGKVDHPDVLYYNGGKVFIVCYTKAIYIVDVVNEKIGNIDVINCRYAYHGIFAKNNLIYAGSVDQNVCCGITVYQDKIFKCHIEIGDLVKGIKRVKGLQLVDNRDNIWVLICDGKDKVETLIYDSYVLLIKIKNNTTILLSHKVLKRCHVDDLVVDTKNQVFIAGHFEEDGGNIIKMKIQNNRLKNINYYLIEDFPHGIDIFEDKIAYTSYATSQIIVTNLDSFN